MQRWSQVLASITLGVSGSVALSGCTDLAFAYLPGHPMSRAEHALDAEVRAEFKSAARRARGLRFAVIGDAGSGDAPQARVARRMCAHHKRAPFDLVVTTGDNVYPAGERRDFEDRFFKPYSCLLKRGVRWRATLGNHDYRTARGRPQLQEPAFGMKGRNYVVRKSGVRFVMADSNVLDRSWLKDATKSERGDRWTVVVFHHPVYSPSSEHGSTAGLRPSLPRLFRRSGVDLVLNGHDHIYSASKRLHRIRYVVTGGGGRDLYDCANSWFSATCMERHHFLMVRAGRKAIRVKAIPSSGPAFHTFQTSGRR